MIASTYPDTIKHRGKKYRFKLRAYDKKGGEKLVSDTAKEERKKGCLTKIIKRRGRIHTAYYLYVHRPMYVHIPLKRR